MSISALYIFDYFGNPILWRNFRGAPRPDIIDMFFKFIVQMDDGTTLKPVVQLDDTTVAFIKYNDLHLVTTVSANANIAMVFVFLYKFVDIMKHYFHELKEESIRDNFVVVHELLDEVLDFGHPQTTDSQILMEYITQEGNRSDSKATVPPAVTNAVSWRSEGIKHKRNELYLEITESIDLLANANGSVVSSVINGCVRMKTYLTGMPELRLGLNDRLLYEINDFDLDKSVELEEVKFHHCVRLAKFENDRDICFIPPDGEFELMTYRFNTYVKPPIWVDCVKRCYTNRKVEFLVKASSQLSRFTASNVNILIPVPADADSPVFKADLGTVCYLPETNVLQWSVKSFEGVKELGMTARLRLPSVFAEERETTPPVQVHFEISFFTISGIKVKYLRVLEKSKYDSLIWVRSVTQSGCYQIRLREVLRS